MEVVFHSGLVRAHTHQPEPAPSASSRKNTTGGTPTLMSHQSYQSQYSTFSHSSARDTQSTQGTTASTLFGQQPPAFPPATPVNGGPVEASNNVLNKRADKDTSLFQRCLSLQMRLRLISGFERWLAEEEDKADDDADPVTLLWRTFRRGYPLMDLYNTLGPQTRLVVDESNKKPGSEKRFEKMAAYKFIQGCVNELKYNPEECFILSDLYGDDTTGFVKVTNVVNRVLDTLMHLGIIKTEIEVSDTASITSTVKRTQREHIIDELVQTERTYVQHLELLQSFKKLVEEKGVITGDSVHDIFLNLNALLDFQRRFLIRVEQTNALPSTEQNWGHLFVLYKDAFKVYEPYIANQKKCEEVAMREYEKLRETGGSSEMQQMVESPTHLTSFLLKPFQRLAKYPLLLKELRDKGDLDEGRKSDISSGMEAASAVLHRTNAAIAREERVEAVEELKTLVEDWKGHRIEGFGDLLLYGNFTVLKGESMNAKNEERDYKIYLFEMILLCCKEMNPNKKKNTMMNKPVTKNGKPKLQLKGRIFMQNVTETISLQKPGSYTCQIFWKGDPGIENFIIKFTSEETMKKWATQVDTQRRVWKDHARASNGTTASKPSDTQFNYMRDQVLENPYREDDDDGEDEDVDTVAPGYPQDNYGVRQNSANNPPRSRSTTSESAPLAEADSRVPPPRFPIGYPQPPLTLRTQQLASSAHQDSYFSPTIDSPMSTYSTARTSSSSTGTFPFPRQAPPNGGYHEENNRYTAPAPARSHLSRDATTRNMQRPSLPPNAGSAMSQGRLRAASSPDIHNANAPGRRIANGQQPGVPDVPPFPTHYAYNAAIVNRNHTNSPGSLPPRSATQSPAIQRDRLVQQRTAAELQNADYHVATRRDPGQSNLSRTMTPASSFERSQGTLTPASVDSRTMSPPLPQTSAPQEGNGTLPSQLKVKVHCQSAGSSMTLVVSTNISYQSLKDRIDAKLQRSTSLTLSNGQMKLKYLDDDDLVTIASDEDVQIAFETWKEQQRDLNPAGQALGEIELYCQR
ncbi:Pleckstrin homology domain-containing protein [Massariosphaeria phaeospora]|uniref:Pleckstrin homology domain-containing protein n=1 Tax=Massariosphaeria phaeospora TaxID=100035 RepID=A0A7C8I3E7_9PLEO|nr:Pleckstrin homology domain-containing protein [Massariosphaeria phaeospora]